MRKPPSDLIAFALLVSSCALIAWTGIAGPLFADNFWTGLEKWQTLIAAIVALLAAYLAVRPVYSQLAEQRRQSAAAAVSMIVKAAVSLEAEREIVRKAVDDLRIDGLLWEYDNAPWDEIYASWPEKAFDFTSACRASLRSMKLYSERNPRASASQNCRLNAISALEQLRSGLSDLAKIMRQKTSGLDYEWEEDIPKEEHLPRRRQLDEARESWEETARELDQQLSREIALIWQRIRELERIAIGTS
ncbi:hypothetical protein [Bradyrhizobium sp. NAS96.2]|uniref:hypothetical protein n=1 Tax=Bradyrhizobium sp. NAS96.2 TaxID=1680160 RepID=UPI00093A8444|nr:hypothetical protein [Bradyrhizobium sp. NAS96.2]OKO76373.1 hypothetical protein AC628_18135 [Bradyrhizobium sp. NAS96.2]